MRVFFLNPFFFLHTLEDLVLTLTRHLLDSSSPNPAAMVLPTSRTVKEAFPSIQPHAPNTAQTPNAEHLSLGGRVKQAMWRIGARLKETDMLYSIKCGLATVRPF